MESLQNLASQIDDIKQKLTDKEYKDLMETAHKINKEKQRFVKCLVIKYSVLTYLKDGEDCTEFVAQYSDGFNFERDGGSTSEELRINIDVSTKKEEKIFEVQSSNDEFRCHEINLDKLTMNIQFYDKLKEETYRDGHSGLKGAVIVFLKDM